MKSEYKRLTVQLSNELNKRSYEFIGNFLLGKQEGVDTSDLINLAISSHLTSMFNTMDFLSNDHPEMHKDVKKFTKNVMEFIATLHPIQGMEVINNDA